MRRVGQHEGHAVRGRPGVERLVRQDHVAGSVEQVVGGGPHAAHVEDFGGDGEDAGGDHRIRDPAAFADVVIGHHGRIG